MNERMGDGGTRCAADWVRNTQRWTNSERKKPEQVDFRSSPAPARLAFELQSKVINKDEQLWWWLVWKCVSIHFHLSNFVSSAQVCFYVFWRPHDLFCGCYPLGIFAWLNRSANQRKRTESENIKRTRLIISLVRAALRLIAFGRGQNKFGRQHWQTADWITSTLELNFRFHLLSLFALFSHELNTVSISPSLQIISSF